MKSIAFLFAILFAINLSAQNFSISSAKTNVVYLGLDNPINIFTQESFDTIIVSTNNGKIEMVSNCLANWRATKTGKGQVIVFGVKNNDTTFVGSDFFNIESFPAPLPNINWNNSDSIMKDELGKANYISYKFPIDFDIDCRCFVLGFTIIFIREDSVFYIEDTEGFEISESTKNIFHETLPGDILVICNTRFLWCSGGGVGLQPKQYIVK